MKGATATGSFKPAKTETGHGHGSTVRERRREDQESTPTRASTSNASGTASAGADCHSGFEKGRIRADLRCCGTGSPSTPGAHRTAGRTAPHHRLQAHGSGQGRLRAAAFQVDARLQGPQPFPVLGRRLLDQPRSSSVADARTRPGPRARALPLVEIHAAKSKRSGLPRLKNCEPSAPCEHLDYLVAAVARRAAYFGLQRHMVDVSAPSVRAEPAPASRASRIDRLHPDGRTAPRARRKCSRCASRGRCAPPGYGRSSCRPRPA